MKSSMGVEQFRKNWEPFIPQTHTPPILCSWVGLSHPQIAYFSHEWAVLSVFYVWRGMHNTGRFLGASEYEYVCVGFIWEV